MLRLYRPYWLIFTLGVIATIGMSSTDGVFSFSLKFIIDDLGHPSEHFVAWLPACIVLLAFGRAAVSVASRYCMSRVVRSVVRDLRHKIFDKVQKLPARYFDHHSTGHMLSTLIYNTDQVIQAGVDVLGSCLQDGAAIIIQLGVMIYMSWKLALIMFLFGPPCGLVARWASRRMRGLSRNVQSLMGDMTHVAEEGIKNYKMIRVYGGQRHELKKFDDTINQSLNRQLKMVVTNSLSVGLVPLVVSIPMAGVIYLFKSTVFSISPGSFVAFLTALVLMIKPLRRCVNFSSQIQQGLAGAEGIFELLDESTEIDQGTRRLQKAHGNIQYSDVCFKYSGADNRALNGVSFTIAPGQTVALVGRSGAGKTTITNILPRFYEIDSGEIMLDGVNITDYKLSDLRAQFSLVSQHITLFNDTVAANIAYGQFGDVTPERIIEAAEAAHALSFINELPNGMQTIIGENGVLLSGGQRQRIAIARAIIKNAPITILDEATSALDTETERHIQAALNQLMQHSTALVVAHRLSTIENADWILVVDEGCVIEQGTHQMLLAQSGAYQKLYEMQFGQQPEAATET